MSLGATIVCGRIKGRGGCQTLGEQMVKEAKSTPLPMRRLSRRASAFSQSACALRRAFPRHACNPAPPAWLRVPPANQAAGPWYPSAIWGGRNCANTIGHLAAERLPEIDMQPAYPCQCLPATGAMKHNMGLSRMHAASKSASIGVTQPTGSSLAEIAALSTSHSPGTAHTHAISLAHRRLQAV